MSEFQEERQMEEERRNLGAGRRKEYTAQKGSFRTEGNRGRQSKR